MMELTIGGKQEPSIPRPTEAEIEAALANVYDWLTRGQDSEWERRAPHGSRLTAVDMQDPTKNEYEPDNTDEVRMSGTFDMRMIVLHALEGAARSRDGKPAVTRA